VEWITGDLMSTHDVGQAIHGVDTVIHLVSTTLPKSSNDDPIYDVQSNLVGTLQLLNIMRQKGVSKILFISSGGTVYGQPEYMPIDEAHPTNPYVSYGITKLAIEKYLLMNQRLYDIRTIILRVSNPYGERQRVETAQGAVGVFINNALINKPIEIWGDGSVIRDYVHVSDVAEAFAKALNYDGAHSIFNISAGTGTSLNTLIQKIESALGITVVRRYLERRSIDLPVNILDNRLASSELNWKPVVELTDGIRRTARWMRILK
jgi:UDP-glucose 4-epimerase